MQSTIVGPSRRVLLGAAGASVFAASARADVATLRIARQFGIGYAQMALMEDQKLIERHARDAGLGDVRVEWSTFRSSDQMNDALLSGNLDIASVGMPGLATIWDRTLGARYEVKGLTGLNVAPLSLVTREASVRSIADYQPGMKIAVPAVKVSNQAIFLQMAAARLWGPASFNRLDPLTTSMSHPDALIAMLSGKGEITSYFGSPPFTQRALKAPGIREVLNSADLLGQAASFNILATSRRFYDDNPRLVAAFVAALAEATGLVNADKAQAAATYARISGDKSPIPDLVEVMSSGITYTMDVQGSLPVVQFMAAIGALKRRPERWTDYMLPSASAYAGS